MIELNNKDLDLIINSLKSRQYAYYYYYNMGVKFDYDICKLTKLINKLEKLQFELLTSKEIK